MRGKQITLKEYVDVKFHSSQIAIDKAETTLNTRLDSMNEFRQALNDRSNAYVTRAEFSAIQKLVYIGLGGILTMELILKFIK